MRYCRVSARQKISHCHLRPPSRAVHRSSLPLVDIQNGTFYRTHPDAVHPTSAAPDANPPMFRNLTYSIPAFPSQRENWAVISTSSSARTAFLHAVQGKFVCIPPTAQTFPYLLTPEVAAKDPRLRSPSLAIQYVGFDAEERDAGAANLRGAYLAARYESHREVTDFSVRDFLTGDTELNPDEALHAASRPSAALLRDVAERLRLAPLLDMTLSNLSNGQMRRTRVGKALMQRPELLLLDGPFMGLDPGTAEALSGVLQTVADHQSPRLLLSLRANERIPEWVSHVALVLDGCRVARLGPKSEALEYLRVQCEAIGRLNLLALDEKWRAMWALGTALRVQPSRRIDPEKGPKQRSKYDSVEDLSVDGFAIHDGSAPPAGEPLVEMQGVKIQYGDRPVLGHWPASEDGASRDGLWWTVRRGERWGLFGPNGSGKTTVVSLITSDHPQTYAAPLKLFGRSRLPAPGEPGLSVFDIQRRVGHSSPEVHAFFPRHLSVRRAIESAFADAPLARPALTAEADGRVTALLRWFQAELHPALGPTAWMRDQQGRRLPRPGGDRRTSRDEVRRFAELAVHDADVAWADARTFGELSFSGQRVALFLRAIAGRPDLVVLDEAFSGMDDAARARCMLFLSWGERKLHAAVTERGSAARSAVVQDSDLSRLGTVTVEGLSPEQALVVISHRKEEVPGCVRQWLCLREVGDGPPREGRLPGPLNIGPESWWQKIWGVESTPVPRRTRKKREAGAKR